MLESVGIVILCEIMVGLNLIIKETHKRHERNHLRRSIRIEDNLRFERNPGFDTIAPSRSISYLWTQGTNFTSRTINYTSTSWASNAEEAMISKFMNLNVT